MLLPFYNINICGDEISRMERQALELVWGFSGSQNVLELEYDRPMVNLSGFVSIFSVIGLLRSFSTRAPTPVRGPDAIDSSSKSYVCLLNLFSHLCGPKPQDLYDTNLRTLITGPLQFQLLLSFYLLTYVLEQLSPKNHNSHTFERRSSSVTA
jgi:hypothetical protein